MTEKNTYNFAKLLWRIGLCILIANLWMEVIVSTDSSGQENSSWGLDCLFDSFILFDNYYSVTHLYTIATICALIAIYHCQRGGYIAQRRLPILPIASIALAVAFVPAISFLPMIDSTLTNARIGWTGYGVWSIGLLCVLGSSLLQRKVREEDMKDSRSFVCRVLGGEPNVAQLCVFWLMSGALCVWPLASFTAFFFYYAPSTGALFDFYRLATSLTVWLYPVYVFPLMRLVFKLSERCHASWIFLITPLIPVGIFLLTYICAFNN